MRNSIQLILFGVILTGCAPSTEADLRCEGEAEVKRLAAALFAIETKEELQRAVPRLKKRFHRLADLVILAHKLNAVPSEPSEASEALFSELARLYETPGAREILEETQREAVRRIDREINTIYEK